MCGQIIDFENKEEEKKKKAEEEKKEKRSSGGIEERNYPCRRSTQLAACRGFYNFNEFRTRGVRPVGGSRKRAG